MWHKKQIDTFTSEPGANKKKKSGALLSLFSPVKSGRIYPRYTKKLRVLKFAFLFFRSSASYDLSATHRLCFAQIAATNEISAGSLHFHGKTTRRFRERERERILLVARYYARSCNKVAARNIKEGSVLVIKRSPIPFVRRIKNEWHRRETEYNIVVAREISLFPRRKSKLLFLLLLLHLLFAPPPRSISLTTASTKLLLAEMKTARCCC